MKEKEGEGEGGGGEKEEKEEEKGILAFCSNLFISRTSLVSAVHLDSLCLINPSMKDLRSARRVSLNCQTRLTIMTINQESKQAENHTKYLLLWSEIIRSKSEKIYITV